MAAGRHGARDRDFRVQDSELEVSRKREFYLERHRDGGESRTDLSRRGELTNGFRNSPLSNSSSGSDRERGRSVRKLVDREPGELSSGSGSDGTPEVRLRDNGNRKNENGFGNSPSKKRKFTPIVWDKEDKDKDKEKVGKESSFSAALPPLPPPPPEERQLRKAPESWNSASEVDAEVFFDRDFRNHVESEKMEEDEEEYQTTRNISSSRWADVDNGLDDDVDLYDEKPMVMKRKAGTMSTKLDNVMPVVAGSPELGEVISREGSEDAKSKSSGSERGRSDEPDVEEDRSNYMDIDREEGDEYRSDHFSDTNSEDEDGGSRSLELERPPQRLIDMLQGCRNVDEFEKLNKIDEGTYGVVYRVKDKKTGEIVALKKVKMEKEREGFPLTSLREINILLSFHHPSIVDVKEVVISRDLQNIFMVMEYMEHDLKGLMETMKQPFSQSEVKCLMLQLLSGVKYLHDNWVLHRDLKTSNLLFNNRGELKICDFGLSRQYGSPLKPYTQLVVTLWYRAPELLLGAKEYSTAIDMWSLGCIMAELLGKEPLFNGKTELDQLDKMFRILGNPTPEVWPEITELSGWKTTSLKSKYKYNRLREKFPAASFSGQPTLSEAGFNLLNQLLTYDPEKRITADEALNHEWFREVPLPKSKDFMPTFPAQHAQDRRHRRLMKSPDPLEELRLKELQGKLVTGSIFG